MVNEVTLIGNLGKDAELRHTNNGTAVCQFSIATSKNYKDPQGNWQQSTEWHNVVIWGDAGERLSKELKSGMRVYVKGELRTNKYDKDGQTHYSTKIVALTTKILDRKEKENEFTESSTYENLPF